MWAKDRRKAVDVLYRRVDKHFGDAGTDHSVILKTVWKACEDEVQRLTTVWKNFIGRRCPVRPYQYAQYYCEPISPHLDEKSGFEFSRDDVHESFAKVHPLEALFQYVRSSWSP